jgi:hypothetical protein
MEACLEYSNKHSASIKYWEFLECLSNSWLLKKDSTPWSYFNSFFYNMTKFRPGNKLNMDAHN